MTRLLETNQCYSCLLFLSCLIKALMLSPVILCLVEHSVSGLAPAAAQSPADPNSSQWDMRSMVVLKGSPYHLCTEGFSRLLCHDWCALTAQSA